MKTTSLFFAFCLLFYFSSFSQVPTASKIRQDINSPGILNIEMSPGKGELYLHRSDLVKYWDKGVIVYRNAKIPEYPNAKVKIYGLARYHVTGTAYTYQKFLTTYNEYEGIPMPSDNDLLSIVKADLPALVRGLEGSIIGELKSLEILPKAGSWPSPKSCVKQFKLTYDYRLSYTEIADMEEIVEVRFYRDAISSPWKKNFVRSSKGRTERGKKTYLKEEIDRMPSFMALRNKEQANAHASSLPTVEIPQFQTFTQMTLFLHKYLREGSEKEIEAVLLNLLAPNFFADFDNRVLNQRGKDLIKRTITAAVSGAEGARYRDQFCPDPGYDSRRSTANRIYLNGVLKSSISYPVNVQIAGQQSGGKYVNGVKQGQEWKITELYVRVRKDQDAIDFVNSFTDRSLLCPQN